MASTLLQALEHLFSLKESELHESKTLFLRLERQRDELQKNIFALKEKCEEQQKEGLQLRQDQEQKLRGIVLLNQLTALRELEFESLEKLKKNRHLLHLEEQNLNRIQKEEEHIKDLIVSQLSELKAIKSKIKIKLEEEKKRKEEREQERQTESQIHHKKNKPW